MATAIAVLVVILVIALLVRFFVRARGPEDAARHEDGLPHADTRSRDFYRGAERPAGPDAEAQVPPEHPGGPTR